MTKPREKKETHPIVIRILDILKERGLTKADLAGTIGSSASLITKWTTEGYMPQIEKIETISNFLDVSVEYIITGKGTNERLSLIKNKNLSLSEMELVTLYRSLDDVQKAKILAELKAKSGQLMIVPDKEKFKA